MKRFAADLDCVFAFYRLPEIHANEKKLAEIKAKGREVISPLNKEGIITVCSTLTTSLPPPSALQTVSWRFAGRRRGRF